MSGQTEELLCLIPVVVRGRLLLFRGSHALALALLGAGRDSLLDELVGMIGPELGAVDIAAELRGGDGDFAGLAFGAGRVEVGAGEVTELEAQAGVGCRVALGVAEDLGRWLVGGVK